MNNEQHEAKTATMASRSKYDLTLEAVRLQIPNASKSGQRRATDWVMAAAPTESDSRQRRRALSRASAKVAAARFQPRGLQ